MTRLLIVACSQAKRPDIRSMDAIERYDGPVFRMLRRARSAGLLIDVEVKILSAKYGLIPEDWLIHDTVSVDLWRWLGQHAECVDVFVNVGRQYAPALAWFDDWCARRGIVVTHAAGGIGVRVAQTKQWLERVNRESAL